MWIHLPALVLAAVTVGEDPQQTAIPPTLPLFCVIVQLMRVGAERVWQKRPPPLKPAEFPAITQLVSSGAEFCSQCTPPPSLPAAFPKIVHCRRLGEDLLAQKTPPPECAAALRKILQRTNVGEENWAQKTPPPSRPPGISMSVSNTPCPPVNVKPSRTMHPPRTKARPVTTTSGNTNILPLPVGVEALSEGTGSATSSLPSALASPRLNAFSRGGQNS